MEWVKPTPYHLSNGLNTSRSIAPHSFLDETQFHQSLGYLQSLFPLWREAAYSPHHLEKLELPKYSGCYKSAYAPRQYGYDLCLWMFDTLLTRQLAE
jgi:hypothetical protein